MKISRYEDGKKVIYVSKEMCRWLYDEFNECIESPECPALLGDSLIRFGDFVRYDKPEDVKFFEELDFIIDLDEYRIVFMEEAFKAKLKNFYKKRERDKVNNPFKYNRYSYDDETYACACMMNRQWLMLLNHMFGIEKIEFPDGYEISFKGCRITCTGMKFF